MITTAQELKEYLDIEAKIYDYKWYYKLPFRLTERQIMYKHMEALRKAEYAYNTNRIFRRFRLFKLLRIQTLYGISIPLNVVGKGFEMVHLGSVIINSNAQIGDYCQVHPGVCIGANHDMAPKIGEHVYVGPGAKVFGDITIADRVEIGANAVVTKSCTTVGAHLLGVPAKEVNKM